MNGDRRPETGDRRPETGDRKPDLAMENAVGATLAVALPFKPVTGNHGNRLPVNSNQ
ncbi:MAG: hypothetical protein ACOZDD_13645 [Bacteroidota bacterium]